MNEEVIKGLSPANVFHFFAKIADIPHGSRNTAAISDYIAGFASERGLKYRQDKMGNVIIWKDGKGDTPVILQGHMDMVCEKEPGCDKDMDKEGLELVTDGKSLYAKGTTLGGDDGIAVAMMLAILERDDDELPPIEAIFTVDEEIGMLGAAGIDLSDIKGRTMINIDSEEEGIFTVSCAGGVVAVASVNAESEKISGDYVAYEISVQGLTGGHSGIEIHKNRANAIVLLGRLIQILNDETDLKICDIKGGAKDNAIAVSASASVVIKAIDQDRVRDAYERFCRDAEIEYSMTDPDMNISLRRIDNLPNGTSAMTRHSTDDIIYMLTCLPNGIQRMSPLVEDLVRTSLNMGILRCTGKDTDEERVELTFCVRSSVASEKDMLKRRLTQAMKAIGGRVEFEGEYPGWMYLKDSPLREIMKEVYVSQYGEEPLIEAVHAGVECGFFASKLKGLDCVSIGPNLSEIHTYRESMEVSSVERTYELVLKTLHRIGRS